MSLKAIFTYEGNFQIIIGWCWNLCSYGAQAKDSLLGRESPLTVDLKKHSLKSNPKIAAFRYILLINLLDKFWTFIQQNTLPGIRWVTNYIIYVSFLHNRHFWNLMVYTELDMEMCKIYSFSFVYYFYTYVLEFDYFVALYMVYMFQLNI